MENFWSSQIAGSNRICLPRNGFSNNVYLKDMYITLKEIGNILFVSVLRILLMYKFLNFPIVFTEKNFPEFPNNFLCEKVNISLIHPIHFTIHIF